MSLIGKMIIPTGVVLCNNCWKTHLRDIPNVANRYPTSTLYDVNVSQYWQYCHVCSSLMNEGTFNVKGTPCELFGRRPIWEVYNSGVHTREITDPEHGTIVFSDEIIMGLIKDESDNYDSPDAVEVDAQIGLTVPCELLWEVSPETLMDMYLDRKANIVAERKRDWTLTPVKHYPNDTPIETWDKIDMRIATKVQAHPDWVNRVIQASTSDDAYDRRSPWYWVRLANGDLLLATYPQADLYEEISHTLGDM